MARQKYLLKDGTEVPGTTTIIGRFKEKDSLIHWSWGLGMKGLDYRTVRDDAADIGSVVHKMVEADIQGHEVQPSPIPEVMSAFDAYLTWKGTNQVQFVYWEIPLVSEKYKFGGKPDAVGFFANELALFDWKTSKGVYPDFLVQLAAYTQLWEENFPHRPLTGGAHLVRFDKATASPDPHHYRGFEKEWRLFELWREAYEIDRDIKKRAA